MTFSTAVLVAIAGWLIYRAATHVREARRDLRAGWRVGHAGRDSMFYEERIGDKWERLPIDGEMLTGRSHHVVYFASEKEWHEYPPWARGRRKEIHQRIKSKFVPPGYEYEGE